MFSRDEVSEKKNRIRTLLAELKLDGIYLKKRSNFSWLTAGGQNAVSIATEMGVAGLLIMPNKEYAISNNIEATRMEKEELLGDQGYEIRSFPWHEDQEVDLLRELGGSRIGSDHTLDGLSDISAKISPLRYSLTPWEVARYKKAGALNAQAAEDAAATIEPGDTECEVIGRVQERLWANRLDPVVTMCAADERIADYRHPIATEKKIRKRVMLSVTARKWGLIVSSTRFVQFGRLPEEIAEKYRINVEIDCIMMANTIPGKPAVEAYNKGIEAYEKYGYPDEWRLHHQGGAVGYVARDYKVTSETREIVQENQGFAWNPSITGCKSEDTIVATSTEPVIVSPTQSYPVIKVKVGNTLFRRPAILEK